MTLPRTTTMIPAIQYWRRPVVPTIVLILLAPLLASCVLSQEQQQRGITKASLPTPTYSQIEQFDNYRQKLCDRYFTIGPDGKKVDFSQALSGVSLNIITRRSSYFQYSGETGVDEESFLPKLLDELASERRANFTWRDSFAVSDGPENSTVTWTQMLELYTEMFDISVDYWDRNAQRLNKGIAFMDQWFDGNMIIIEKIKPSGKNKVDFLNFTKPFTSEVWLITLATVVFSAIVFQWLEWINNQRDGRTFWKWCEDHIYLSSLNFTQQYLYEPTSGAGRIFGFSMAVWAMVMGATYTANLASLFVETGGGPKTVQDIDDAVRRELRICTWKGTNSDQYLHKRYRQATLIPINDEFDMYQGLHTGTCDVVIGAVSSWDGHERDIGYNPDCDLKWVGRVIQEVSSSFAVKADPADKCTNLVRDVLNYHLSEMKSEGIFEALWEEHLDRLATIDCLNPDAQSDDGDRRLQLRGLPSPTEFDKQNRGLKAGAGGGGNPAAAASGGDEDGESLGIQAMAGTFVLHAILSAVAIAVGLFTSWRKKGQEPLVVENSENSEVPVSAVGQPYRKVYGGSLASGETGANSVKSMITHGNVQDQLLALHEQQEKLAEQMATLISAISKGQGGKANGKFSVGRS